MNKINRLQLRSEKLEQHQYDLDNLLKDLEKKEYIDYYNDIKNIKTYESQARILDELPISIKPPDVVNLVLGVEKKAWAVNNYLDYYSHKQKWMYLRRLYILSRLKQAIRKAPLMDKKTSQKKGFEILLKRIQQIQIQKVLNEYATRKFAFNRLHYNLVLVKKYSKAKKANDNETAVLFHDLSKVIKGFRYIKENCYDKRSNLISKKTINVIVIKQNRYFTLKRGFKLLGSKIIQRKAISKSIRKYRIRTIRKYFRYFVQLLQLCRGIKIKSLTSNRKVKKIDYNRLKRSFHKLLEFRNKSHDNIVVYNSSRSIHRKYLLIKYLQIWRNYLHFGLQKRMKFSKKYTIRNKKFLSKYLSLWREKLDFKLLSRSTLAHNFTKAKKFYLRKHGLFYLQRWIHSMTFHTVKRNKSKLKHRRVARKRIYFSLWFHYTTKQVNYKKLNKKGVTFCRKLMIKRGIKLWILFTNKCKMLKNRVALRVYSTTRKKDDKKSHLPHDKPSSKIKTITSAVLNGRVFHCICLKHVLLKWYQYLKEKKRRPKVDSNSKAYWARKHSVLLTWIHVARISKRLNDMYHYSHRHAKKKALKLFFSKLQKSIMRRVEEDRVLKNFSERIVRPIKIRSGFDALHNRYASKNVHSSDPRVRICDLARVSNYLSDWKDNFFYKKEVNHIVKSHHRIRNIVNLLKSITVWKSVVELKYESQRNYRYSDNLRRETLLSPIFSSWRLVARTHSHSIVMNALMIVRNYTKRKYWFRLLSRFIKIKTKFIECSAANKQIAIKIKRNLLLYSFKRFKRNLQRLFTLKSMIQLADKVRAKNLKKNIFHGISKAVYVETEKYRNARNLWKSLSFKRSKRYLTKVQRRKYSLSIAHRKFMICSMTSAMKRVKEWKYLEWKRRSYMSLELGAAKCLIMKVSHALKKLKYHVSISAIRNRSLVITMMHLLRRVLIHFNDYTSQKKVRKDEIKKFLYSRMKWGLNQFLRYSYIGKYKALKKNRNRARSKDIYYELQNIYHPQYRLSLFCDPRVSKQRLIYQNAATWRSVIKLSKVFVAKLNYMKRSKKRNIKRTKVMRSYILSREFYHWIDYFQSKKYRMDYLLLILNDFKKKNCLKKLKQFAFLSKNDRIITNKILKKTLIFWVRHKKNRLIAKKVIVKCILKLDVFMVRHRLDVWKDDIKFQKLEEKKQQVYIIMRKRFYLIKLRKLSTLRRKIRITIRRFKGIKYSRKLKKVFVALMKNLEVKYKNQDKLKCANKFNLDFLRSYVLHRFYLLRRNRIAREYILTKKNKLLLSNIKRMQRNCNYFRSLIKTSNLLFMKKGFHRLKASLAHDRKKATKKRKDLEKKNYTTIKMRMMIMQKLDRWRALFTIRVSLNHLASYITKQDTFKGLYKDVNNYRNHKLMRKAIKAFLRIRRSHRRIKSSIKYLEKYYIEKTLCRSFKQIDTFACKHFTQKINLRLLSESSKKNCILHAFKKFIVRKRKNIMSN